MAADILQSVEAVSLGRFLLATLALMPKFFLHVFIGSRMADLSDGEHRRNMDPTTKILNVTFIVIGILVAIFTGVCVWRCRHNAHLTTMIFTRRYVYRVTQAQIRQLESSREQRNLATAAVDDLEEAPLLETFSDDGNSAPLLRS